MIKNRLARIRAILMERNLDALLVTRPSSRRYLSGYKPDDTQLGETSGALLISQNQAAILTDFRYALSAEEQAPLFKPVIYKRGLAEGLAQALADDGCARIAFEAEALLVEHHARIRERLDGVELVPTRGLVETLRRLKQSQEVEAMRRSLALMEEVLAGVIDKGLVGRTERQVALELMRTVEDQGAEGPAFSPIVAAGPAGAEPHAEPGDTVIEKGAPVILDVGAKLAGYSSDITRTVVAGGVDAADDTFKKVYPVVRAAQLKAIAEIKPGMSGQEADALAREVIDDAGYGQYFGHSLGHGVGLDTHEAPSVSPLSDDVLEVGNVFTVEPGIYLPGWGGVRLEQMVELTDDGCRLLNRLDDFYGL